MDRGKNTNISDIIIVGDLNNDLSKPSKGKHLRELIGNYELSQLIKEPTHFTEISSSLKTHFDASLPGVAWSNDP